MFRTQNTREYREYCVLQVLSTEGIAVLTAEILRVLAVLALLTAEMLQRERGFNRNTSTRYLIRTWYVEVWELKLYFYPSDEDKKKKKKNGRNTASTGR